MLLITNSDGLSALEQTRASAQQRITLQEEKSRKWRSTATYQELKAVQVVNLLILALKIESREKIQLGGMLTITAHEMHTVFPIFAKNLEIKGPFYKNKNKRKKCPAVIFTSQYDGLGRSSSRLFLIHPIPKKDTENDTLLLQARKAGLTAPAEKILKAAKDVHDMLIANRKPT